MLPEYNNIILNRDIVYDFNPFGGITEEDILDCIVPKYPLEEWIKLLNNDQPIILQFVGKKGRGKTTHLRLLYQLVDNADIFFLNKNEKLPIIQSTKEIVFIDSIHHIPIKQRLQLWKNESKSYIITTHVKRNLEFHFTNRLFKTYKFKGITEQILENIIRHRVVLSSNLEEQSIKINQELIQYLIKKYKDDIRSILNFLYYNFKTQSYGS